MKNEFNDIAHHGQLIHEKFGNEKIFFEKWYFMVDGPVFWGYNAVLMVPKHESLMGK